jgi:hypothetical protein
MDEVTGNLIGQVSDIQQQGLNLISKSEIVLDEDVHVWLENSRGEFKIPLIIKGIWNHMYEEPVFYTTGCQVVESIAAMRYLINNIHQPSKKIQATFLNQLLLLHQSQIL